MRHTFLIALTLVLALSMQAQTTVAFMGVPVKGGQEAFKQELLKKGCYTDKNGVLKGVVDGALSTVIVNVVNSVVKSVTAIEDERLADEQVAIGRYNNLIDYYKTNPDYTEFESNPYVENAHPATVQRNISENYYYAEFFQKTRNQRYTRRLGFGISDKYNGYRIVRHYDNNYDIDVKLPK